jgi:V/A-type H+/Na+-transporting ATPase subunit D
MNLLQRRSRMAQARQAADLLTRKRDALATNFWGLVRRARAARTRLIRLSAECYRILSLAKAVEGPEVLDSVAFVDSRRFSVEIGTANLWGVEVPEVMGNGLYRTMLERGHDPIAVSWRAVECADHFEDLVSVLLSAASIEATLAKVGDEIRKTTRRVNALEQILIPQLREEIQQIATKLEERAREDIFRLKRVKKKLAKRRRDRRP